MNTKRIFGFGAAIAATAALVFSCITFNSINYPSNPKANSDFEVTLQVQLVPETERSGNFILAFVAPKSWKVGETISASYSATNVQSGGAMINIDNEAMTFDTETVEPTTGLVYKSAMLSKYGVLGNTGPVEWIVLKGSTRIDTNGAGEHPTTTADVKIKFKTGSTNIKYFTAFATCLSDNGFNDGNDGEYICSETSMIQVTGGDGNEDYTVLHYVSTTPQDFRYGDYVSIEFVSTIDGADTPLYGESEVYMKVTAVLENGDVIVADPVLMKKKDAESYSKYIYPKSLLKVGENAKIKMMYVSFQDKAGTKVVTDGDYGFEVSQKKQ